MRVKIPVGPDANDFHFAFYCRVIFCDRRQIETWHRKVGEFPTGRIAQLPLRSGVDDAFWNWAI